MSKVSVLMNCYNGEEYLKQAIDSVYSQTFIDWEIVFIDNCSTDNSAEIAKSYDNKIKYYRTEQNIPLGAARNFGLKYCEGEFISFLDTDDIWFLDTLQLMVSNIDNSEFAVVYGGHINIDKNGKKVGQLIPSKKEGEILPDLLVQYDIPIVSSIINLSVLRKLNILFIESFTMFEDYALFLELSVTQKIKAINQPLLLYRVHDNSSSTKKLANWAKERRETLDKILATAPDLISKYSLEFREAYSRANYYDAMYFMSINEKIKARESLSKVKTNSTKYLLLWLVLFLPKNIWKVIQYVKYKRSF